MCCVFPIELDCLFIIHLFIFLYEMLIFRIHKYVDQGRKNMWTCHDSNLVQPAYKPLLVSSVTKVTIYSVCHKPKQAGSLNIFKEMLYWLF